MTIKLLDCTLRDGGYYNAWDFSTPLIEDYLEAMQAVSVDFVELGFRSLDTKGFRGASAYTTDTFIRTLRVPNGMKLGVMINAGELLGFPDGVEAALRRLFASASESPVSLVRIACHVHEFERVLGAVPWLKEQGYLVGFNLMQVADRSTEAIAQLARVAARYPIDVIYFADSMGGLSPAQTKTVIAAFREGWVGELGVHAHDNMGRALANSMVALDEGATWVDGTVSGMGRGPGNARTEYLVLELESRRQVPVNLTPLLRTIRQHFRPLLAHYGWGSNPYYYLAGKYSIHPTYIQEMLGDSRYTEEDILTVIDRVRAEGGRNFSLSNLEAARQFYPKKAPGTWAPASLIRGRDVLILGSGPGVRAHQRALEAFIAREKPCVMALNTQQALDEHLIDVRVACHPVRLLVDATEHTRLPQPLVTPVSMLPADLQTQLAGKTLLDFGISVQRDTFEFHERHAVIPNVLVLSYALAIATSGEASRILLAGFDGYGAEDPRQREVDAVFQNYRRAAGARELLAVTPSRYDVAATSVYSLIA